MTFWGPGIFLYNPPGDMEIYGALSIPGAGCCSDSGSRANPSKGKYSHKRGLMREYEGTMSHCCQLGVVRFCWGSPTLGRTMKETKRTHFGMLQGRFFLGQNNRAIKLLFAERWATAAPTLPPLPNDD